MYLDDCKHLCWRLNEHYKSWQGIYHFITSWGIKRLPDVASIILLLAGCWCFKLPFPVLTVKFYVLTVAGLAKLFFCSQGVWYHHLVEIYIFGYGDISSWLYRCIAASKNKNICKHDCICFFCSCKTLKI